MSSKYILGVDVGTSSVKVLAAAIEGGKVLVKGSGSVPSAGFVKGAVTDAGALASAIEAAVDCAVMAAAVPRENIYLGIGGSDLISQSSIGSIAPAGNIVAPGDIERACRAATIVAVEEDHRALHVLPTGYWLDGQRETEAPLGKSGSRLDVEAHIVSVPRSGVEEVTAILAKRSFSVAGVMANAIVTGASLAAAEPVACLVLDIGAGLTDAAIYSGGQIAMSASIPLGGDYITADIMQGLDVSFTHAEEIKRYYARLDKTLKGNEVVLDCNDYGTTDKQIAYDFLSTIVESRVEEIVSLIHLYLEPALIRHQPEKIILTGGATLLPSLGELVEKTFAMPVQPGLAAATIPPEYAKPGNLAAFCLLQYVAKLSPQEPVVDSGSLRSFLRKLKEYI
jgi:cell division protein FtsA